MSRAAPGPEDLLALLLQVMGAIRDALDAEAAALGLSSRQALALLHLEQPLPMRELAASLRCDASNVTSLADVLESRGLLQRAPGPLGADRRVKRLVLTGEGVALRLNLQRRLSSQTCVISALDAGGRRDLAALLSRMVGG